MPANRKTLWLAAKTGLALLILVLVARQFALVLHKDEFRSYPLQLRWGYLIPAGLLYLGAHTFWGTFWVRLLRSQGLPVGYGVGLRAYFVSQFGKYIPGKVAVIVMRTEMLRPFGCPRLPVAVTATYETLTSMGAGAMLGVLLLPYVVALPDEVGRNVAWFLAVACLPLGLGVLNKMVVRVAKKARRPDAPALPSPPLLLLVQGLLHGACGWCLLALSLALTVRAVAPTLPEWHGVDFLADVAAVALSYVAGFVVLVAPGGLGARELVLQKAVGWRFAATLGPDLANGLGVVIALVLRLVWTAAEALLALALYVWKPTPPGAPPRPVGEEGNHACTPA